MFKINTLALVIALGLSSTVLTGCPKQTAPTEGVVDPTAAFMAGVKLLQEPGKDGTIDYGAAYTQFNTAATAKPDFAKAQYNAGWTAEQLGKLADAEQHYRKALTADPNNGDTAFALADVLTRQKKAAEAVTLFKGRVDANADDLKSRNALMEALVASEQHDDAIEQAKQILLRDSKNVNAYRNLSRLYFAKGEYKLSQLCAEKAKELAAGDSGIYNNIGVTFLVMGEEASAIEEFKTAIKLDPDNVEANLNLGYVALNSGDFMLARTAFEAALQGEPGNIDGKLGMAVALRGLKEYDQSGKLYDEVIKADPRNQKAYFNAATLYEKYVKDYKRAEKVLQEFINANNKDGSIGPAHEVFQRIDRIKESQQIEEARLREEERKKKEAEERKKRQEAELDKLKTKLAELKAIAEKYQACEAFAMGVGEEAKMVIENAQMVVEANDAEMAGDVSTFVDQILPMATEAAAACGGGAPAPAPAEGGAPAAPAEPAPAAPAEPAPAPQ
jgi:tetratricopeptide (TPR) repeat protein